MPTKIFVNLPVTDLGRSIAFYKALGFAQNLQFSDDTAACMVISEENHVMLLTHAKFKGFSDAPIPDAKTAVLASGMGASEKPLNFACVSSITWFSSLITMQAAVSSLNCRFCAKPSAL